MSALKVGGWDLCLTVCVCQTCHNPTLALGGSGMASDEPFKRIFQADPHRDMTTKVECTHSAAFISDAVICYDIV